MTHPFAAHYAPRNRSAVGNRFSRIARLPGVAHAADVLAGVKEEATRRGDRALIDALGCYPDEALDYADAAHWKWRRLTAQQREWHERAGAVPFLKGPATPAQRAFLRQHGHQRAMTKGEAAALIAEIRGGGRAGARTPDRPAALRRPAAPRRGPPARAAAEPRASPVRAARPRGVAALAICTAGGEGRDVAQGALRPGHGAARPMERPRRPPGLRRRGRRLRGGRLRRRGDRAGRRRPARRHRPRPLPRRWRPDVRGGGDRRDDRLLCRDDTVRPRAACVVSGVLTRQGDRARRHRDIRRPPVHHRHRQALRRHSVCDRPGAGGRDGALRASGRRTGHGGGRHARDDTETPRVPRAAREGGGPPAIADSSPAASSIRGWRRDPRGGGAPSLRAHQGRRGRRPYRHQAGRRRVCEREQPRPSRALRPAPARASDEDAIAAFLDTPLGRDEADERGADIDRWLALSCRNGREWLANEPPTTPAAQYVRVDAAFLAARLKPSALAVAVVLAAHAPNIFPSQTTIARQIDVSTGDVSNQLALLQQRHLVAVIAHRGRQAVYELATTDAPPVRLSMAHYEGACRCGKDALAVLALFATASQRKPRSPPGWTSHRGGSPRRCGGWSGKGR